jgi:two-component system, OmpR family, KDP operon response regulator KdpE
MRNSDEAGQRSQSAHLGRAGRRAWTVLIVDPDVEGARRLAVSLAPNIVAIVGSARAAFEAIQSRIPDLIVTELDLPDMPGAEFILRIHSTPATHNVLLLVATRRTAVSDKIAAFQAGADDYLVKPLTPQQFVAHAQLVSRFLQVIGRELPGPPTQSSSPGE